MALKCTVHDIAVQTVALPRLQYRVSTHAANAHTPYCQPHSQKTATPLSNFGRTRAPNRSSGLDRKNTVTGQFRGKAATAFNLGLAQAGHCFVGKCLQNSKLCGS